MIMMNDDPHDMRQFWVADSRCLGSTAGDGGGRYNVVWSFALTCQASSGKDCMGRQILVSPVLTEDGRTAQLGTLVAYRACG